MSLYFAWKVAVLQQVIKFASEHLSDSAKHILFYDFQKKLSDELLHSQLKIAKFKLRAEENAKSLNCTINVQCEINKERARLGIQMVVNTRLREFSIQEWLQNQMAKQLRGKISGQYVHSFKKLLGRKKEEVVRAGKVEAKRIDYHGE